MSDPAPPPAPEPDPNKPKHSRSEVNQAHLAEVANSRKVAAAAVDPDNAASLAAEEMDATLPGKITALADKVEANLGKLVGTRAGKKATTKQEEAARKALMDAISPIQTATKRKFTGNNQNIREAYFIGAGLADDTLEHILAAARSILARLTPGENNTPPTDTLPGVKADGKIKKLSDAIATYGDTNQQQGDQQTDAEKLHEIIEADVVTLAGYRHQVQLAADQAWPWRTAGVAPIRKAFLLPTNRPLAQ